MILLNQAYGFLRYILFAFLCQQRRLKDVAVPMNNRVSQSSEDENVPEFCIDAGTKGNFARFINHSCEPNLFVQCVLSSHQDLRLARVVLFAADNIPPLQVLRNSSVRGDSLKHSLYKRNVITFSCLNCRS